MKNTECVMNKELNVVRVDERAGCVWRGRNASYILVPTVRRKKETRVTVNA